MARKPRIHAPGAFYHVTLRGNHRQDIFFCDEHRRWLDDIVAGTLQRYGARVHAYCWMTNHIHLLLQVGDVPLWRVMLRIASMYARRVQKHLVTTGHLFERRYDPTLVDADEYLITLLRYIHLNPVRAGMVKTPDEYPWSSHSAYAGGAAPPWLTTEFAKGLLHRDSSGAEDVYRRMMADELVRPTPKPFDQVNPVDKRMLGCDAFVAAIQSASWRPRSRESIDQVIVRVCREQSVSIEELYSRSRKPAVTRARVQVARTCLEGRIASLSEVAQKLGRHESTLRESMEIHFPRK